MSSSIPDIDSIEDNNVSSFATALIQSQSANLDEVSRQDLLRFLCSSIDLTTLSCEDTSADVQQLCEKALMLNISEKNKTKVAAVCVYTPFIPLCVKTLEDSGVAVASVAGAFPSGQSPTVLKLKEVEYALSEGAEEIDFVPSIGRFLESDFSYVEKEISEAKKMCGDRLLKIILETGVLKTVRNIRVASELAIACGADFLKTSTGKCSPSATIEAVLVMMLVVEEYWKKSGKVVGIKPSGGISSVEDAEPYYLLLQKILGDRWMNSSGFRLGASRLLDSIIAEIQGEPMVEGS